jgi:hypothetical protein
MFDYFKWLLKYGMALGLAFWLMQPAVAKATGDWDIKSQVDGITIYNKRENNENLLSYKAEAVINAPLDIIFYFFKDVEKSVRFTPGTQEKRVLEELSDKDRIEYVLSKLPWPFKDRYLIYRAKETVHTGKEVLFTVNSVEGYPYKEEDRILGAIKNSRFLLKSMEADSSKTLVMAEVYLDPGGWLPHWFIELYTPNWAGRLLKQLKIQVEEYVVQQKNPEFK